MEIASTSQDAPIFQRKNPYTITSDILRKRIQHENRGRYITQLYAAVVACTAALSFGIMLGWSTPAAIKLMKVTEKRIKINVTEKDNVLAASLMPLGCSLGIFPWSYSIQKIGPKHTMILQTPFHIFTLLLMITYKKIQTYLISRFFSGFISISFVVAGECLLIDSVHRSHYSHMIAFFNSSVLFGVLVVYLVGHFLPKIWLSTICIAIPVVNLVFLIFIPESPVFLYDKSQLKAEKALSWYRGRENIYIDLRHIKKDAELRKMGTEIYRHMIYSKVVLKAICIVMGLTFFQILSGYYVFMFYNVLLWSKATYVFDQLTDSTLFGCCMFISNFVGNIFHYRTPYRVRMPLLVSCSLISILLSILTIFLFFQKLNFEFIEKLYFVPFVFLNAFFISYEIGLGTYPGIILFEYLPYQVHPIAKIFIRIYFWFLIFLFTRYFIPICDFIGDYILFGILTLISYLSVVYCTKFVIESKGKTLQQIQMEIGGNPIGNRGAYRTQNVQLRLSISEVNDEGV